VFVPDVEKEAQSSPEEEFKPSSHP
jgi:hypothetical protein